MSVRIFLTGMPRCGKSTVVQKVLEKIGKKGLRIAGILTPEKKLRGERWGFEIIDIASGERGILASVNTKSKVRVSKYGVNVADIDRIAAKFEQSLHIADIIVIDEIGKMEFYSSKFKEVLQKALESNKALLATLHRNLVKDFEKYGEIIVVNEANREILPEVILKRFFEDK
jgi:nucleoside-triphosphatase